MRVTALAAALGWLAVSSAGAEPRHEVRPGETLDSLAAHYYGSAALGQMLGSYNELEGELEPGTPLRLPSGRDYTVRAGDSWALLAKRQLGDSSLAGTLAELNGSSLEGPLRIGRQLAIPVLVEYVVAPGDSFARIARHFYGGPARAGFLQRFNEIESAKRLRVGSRLRVPLTLPLDAVSPRAAESAPLPATPVRAELREGMRAYMEGSYDTALERLESLRAEVLEGGSPEERRQLLRHLAFAYVAYDRPEDACAAYRELLGVEPRPRLDPDQVSPKIRRVLASCSGR